MAAVTPQQFAATWAARMNDPNTQAKIRAGVSNPQANWQANTLRAKDYMVTRWQASMVVDGKWDRNVNSTSDNYWRTRTIQKGLPAMANGVQNGIPNVQAFATQFLPAVQNARAAAQALPKGGVENGIARAAAFIRSMAAFQYVRAAR